MQEALEFLLFALPTYRCRLSASGCDFCRSNYLATFRGRLQLLGFKLPFFCCPDKDYSSISVETCHWIHNNSRQKYLT